MSNYYDETDENYLKITELEKILSVKIDDTELSIVRDYFVLTCLTGFCFRQIGLLKPEHIYIDEEKTKWLKNPYFMKTFNDYKKVAFTDLLQQIIDKYHTHTYRIKQYIFPTLKGCKLEHMLIKLSEMCEIDKELSQILAFQTYRTYRFKKPLPNGDICKHYYYLTLGILSIEMKKFDSFGEKK